MNKIKFNLMEEYNCEMINTFNKNFITSNFKNILRLYKKEIFMVQYSEENNFKQEYIYQHPLFKNYNYCFFCEKKETTKYTKYLDRIHIPLKTKTIGEFLFSNKIQLRHIKNKQIKLAKRRFIKSYDSLPINKINKNIHYDQSDTELYVEDKCDINIKDINSKKSKGNLAKKISQNPINGFVDKIYSPFYGNIKNIKQKNKVKDLIPKNEEKKSSLDDITPNTENIKFNLDQDEMKTNYNMDDSEKNSINKHSHDIISIKNKNIKKDNPELFKRKSANFHKIKNNNITKDTKEVDLPDSSNIHSDIKLSISEKGDKEESNESKNSFDKLNDMNSAKNNAVFDNIVSETKKFFGFGKQNSKNRDNNRRTLTGHLSKNNKNKKNKINYAENNCSICFQEIKEKFTLICGDFFCSDCIRQTILTTMKEIRNLDKLSCPTCKEPIETNTIKKLLTQEEFDHYNYLMTKIQGYRNEGYIPCPYPDCPEFAEESQFNTNIVICQNGHIFCKKCLELFDKNYKEKEHKCFANISLEEKQTLDFFKKNKNIRKCPNCQNQVIREGGECNNMTCTNIWCGYEFCWICNGKYEESHYKNPISMCFGLGDIDNDRKLLKYSRIRFFRCILIFLLIIFIILPFVIVFFSIFEVVIYVLAFVLDGSAMKNIKLKSLFAHKFFYRIVYAFFFCIAIAFIPIGYFSLIGLVISIPIICIYNKIKKKDGEDLE